MRFFCFIFVCSSLVSVSGDLYALGLNSDIKENVDLDLYGQVNQALMISDDGNSTDSYIVDNGNSPTRVGLRAEYHFDQEYTAGVHFEVGYSSNSSILVTQQDRTQSAEFRERHGNVYLKSPFGKLSLGQGDGAANSNIQTDLSGTWIVGPTLLGSSLNFQDKLGAVGPRYGAVLSNQDFESRYDRLRFDLPALGVLKMAVSQGVKDEGSDVTEVGGRAIFDVQGKLALAFGYSTKDTDTIAKDKSTIGGSVSWLHDSGFNLTGAYSKVSDDVPDTPDSKYFMYKVGYKTGKHAVALRYDITYDLDQEDDEASSISVGYVFNPINKIDVYAGYGINSLDRNAADFQDIDVVTLGSRIKF
ncbi:MAG: porin [Alteromonadaceae bacterium]|nr:porin [Alteromonadaceae bacterium]